MNRNFNATLTERLQHYVDHITTGCCNLSVGVALNVWFTTNGSDCGVWSLLLLAATVRGFAHMPLGLGYIYSCPLQSVIDLIDWKTWNNIPASTAGFKRVLFVNPHTGLHTNGLLWTIHDSVSVCAFVIFSHLVSSKQKIIHMKQGAFAVRTSKSCAAQTPLLMHTLMIATRADEKSLRSMAYHAVEKGQTDCFYCYISSRNTNWLRKKTTILNRILNTAKNTSSWNE